jgi:hypothetical protein
MVKIIFDADEDWEKRVLCSDEACIGTIGADGKCKECGKPFQGAAETGSSTGKVATRKKQKITNESENQVSDDDWDKRVLCSDESCIGTIGPDGCCRECGKPGK